MTEELVKATMDEAVKRGLAFELVNVEDPHTGAPLGQVVALLDEDGKQVATLASKVDLADLGRFLGVLPRRATVAA